MLLNWPRGSNMNIPSRLGSLYEDIFSLLEAAEMIPSAQLLNLVNKYSSFRWHPPHWVLEKDESYHQCTRQKMRILVEGEELPPPLTRFIDMKFPPAIIRALRKRDITVPTPIQAQGLPTVYALQLILRFYIFLLQNCRDGFECKAYW